MTDTFNPSHYFADLNLPVQDLAKLSFCGGNRLNQVEKWADQLQATRITHTSALLYQSLPEINRLKVDAKTRLAMLEALRPKVQNIIGGLAQEFLGQSLILPDQAQKTAIVAQALQKTMIDGYSLCIRDWLKQRSLNAQTKDFLATALARGLFGIARLHLRCCQIYGNLPQGLWLHLHNLYRTAEHLGVDQVSVSDTLLQWRRESSIREIYLRPVMLACSRTNQLSQQEIQAAFDAFETWVTHLELLEEVDPDNDNPFVINLSRDAPPIYKTLFDGSEQDYLLELGFHDLVTALQNDRIVKRGVVVPPGVSPQLLSRLTGAWSKAVSRQQQRRQVKTAIDVCVGLTECHYHLAGQKTFSQLLGQSTPGSLSDATEHAAQAGFTPREKPARSSSDPVHPPSRVTVQNISAGGYCLHWQGGMPDNAITGQLLGIREAGQKEWLIGVVRWIRQLRGASQMGVQVLALEAKPAAAAIVYDLGGHSNPMRVLQLAPDETGSLPATLITAAAPFQENSRVRLELSGRTLMIKLDKCLFSTSHTRQFSFHVLTSATREETSPAASDGSFDSDWD